ncbi:hypothetical protein [Pedobacter sp. SYP-B3415]|uniref:hypothetical protein n=1 Tax=Pedobacter sp. SYP-B3415 TaxID=2496641 RepID=UPI00101DCC75|nr:hypothetical protein [Pedobacter sp. SYP-B3415]
MHEDIVYNFFINGRKVNVRAPDKDYRVFIDGHYAGMISPVFSEEGELKWAVVDLISEEWAEKVGEAIERADC